MLSSVSSSSVLVSSERTDGRRIVTLWLAASKYVTLMSAGNYVCNMRQCVSGGYFFLLSSVRSFERASSFSTASLLHCKRCGISAQIYVHMCECRQHSLGNNAARRRADKLRVGRTCARRRCAVVCTKNTHIYTTICIRLAVAIEYDMFVRRYVCRMSSPDNAAEDTRIMHRHARGHTHTNKFRVVVVNAHHRVNMCRMQRFLLQFIARRCTSPIRNSESSAVCGIYSISFDTEIETRKSIVLFFPLSTVCLSSIND